MPNNPCKNESMAILGRRAAVVASSATVRLRFVFLVPLVGAVLLPGLRVASFPAHAVSVQTLVAAADAALYAAKESGRNLISCYEPAPGQAAAQE